MQYSPKLKIAMAEIKAILIKHDIAGSIVLHAPGFGEQALHLTTSYSCAVKNEIGLRMKARAKEDYGGDTKARDLAIEQTIDMLIGFRDFSLHVQQDCQVVLELLKQKFDIDIDRRYDGGNNIGLNN